MPARPPPLLDLIDAAELALLLASPSPPLLLDVSISPLHRPSECIPGARLCDMAQFDLYLDDAPSVPARLPGNYNLRPAAELRRALERLGVHAQAHAVVYTQRLAPPAEAAPPAVRRGDPVVAARLAWLLCVAGVRRVSLLEGGLAAWARRGGPLAPPPPPPRLAAPAAVDFFGGGRLPFPLHPELVATTEEVEAAAGGARGVTVADVRSWREFVGAGHDYPFPLPCGRIPTARWAHWGPSTYDGADFYWTAGEASGALKPLQSVRRLWESWGIDVDAGGEGHRLIFYCGSGWRSAMAWCLARLMGHENVANYDGGMLEWSMCHPAAAEHPIEKGWPWGEAPQPRPATPCSCGQEHGVPPPIPAAKLVR
ncbi:hypothetical protein AB1Y20_016391 [Prymnesium parvum]|uniref:Rhodanese domain-containing protein n=1 Tax=Prymnesium parvum TaxID=97485 RepID=A0AB34ICP6_PRYPA